MHHRAGSSHVGWGVCVCLFTLVLGFSLGFLNWEVRVKLIWSYFSLYRIWWCGESPMLFKPEWPCPHENKTYSSGCSFLFHQWPWSCCAEAGRVHSLILQSWFCHEAAAAYVSACDFRVFQNPRDHGRCFLGERSTSLILLMLHDFCELFLASYHFWFSRWFFYSSSCGDTAKSVIGVILHQEKNVIPILSWCG